MALGFGTSLRRRRPRPVSYVAEPGYRPTHTVPVGLRPREVWNPNAISTPRRRKQLPHEHWNRPKGREALRPRPQPRPQRPPPYQCTPTTPSLGHKQVGDFHSQQHTETKNTTADGQRQTEREPQTTGWPWHTASTRASSVTNAASAPVASPSA